IIPQNRYLVQIVIFFRKFRRSEDCFRTQLHQDSPPRMKVRSGTLQNPPYDVETVDSPVECGSRLVQTDFGLQTIDFVRRDVRGITDDRIEQFRLLQRGIKISLTELNPLKYT